MMDDTIRYTTDGTAPTNTSTVYTLPLTISTKTTLTAAAFKDGWDSAVFSDTYSFNFGTLAAPVASPAAGVYLYGQALTLTAGAVTTIHYTTDGSIPTLTSAVYTGPLTLTGSVTIKAGAFNADWTSSPISTTTYAAKVATPTFSPDGGTYTASQNITINTATPGAVIHFTNNGLDPSVNDPVVANGGTLAVGNFTLKARAFLAGVSDSDVKTAVYVRSGDPCKYALIPSLISVGAHASGGVVAVSAGDSSCSWTVTSDQSWLTLDGASAQGVSAQFAYHVAANTTATSRTALLTLGGEYLLVIQSAQPACTYDVTPGAIVAGGTTSGTLAVTATDGGCGWTASSDVSWAQVALAHGVGAYAQAVLDDQPVGYWRLNEPAGATVVTDATPAGHVGTYSGGVVFGQSGPLADGATAVRFDGTTGFVEIPHDPTFNVSALTWEAWVNVPSTSTEWRKLLGKGATANEVFSLQIGPNMMQPTLYWSVVGAGRQAATLTASVVGAGWVHLAFTYDGATWHAYVNGQEDQSGSLTDALATNASALVFGRDDTLAQSWYDGLLEEVALYSYALNADQIANHVAQRTLMATGGGQVAYALSGNATGASRAGTLTVAGVAVPVNQAAVGGLVISGSVSPPPNAAGWNNTDVTVSFHCAGAGTITCTPPVAVTQEGTWDIPGQASSDLGVTASTSVHVQISKTAPFLSISSQSAGQLVEAGPIVVSGTVADLRTGGGPVTVTCNGAPATVVGLSFTCTPTVPPGTSTITVQATQAASNTRTTTIKVSTVDVVTTTPPTSLHVSPQNVTMMSGEARSFSATDNLGRVPPLVVWSIDNYNIATLTSGTKATLTGVSAGQITLTASWLGLVASTQVTVLAGAFGVTTPPAGTVLWSVPGPISGAAVKQIVQGTATFDGPGRVYTYESTDEWGSSDIIRAVNADGTAAWSADTGGQVAQLSGDPAGGVIALVLDWPPLGTTRLLIFDAHGDAWEGPQGILGGFALHPDGPLYYVDGSNLVSLDIGLGGGYSALLPGVGGVPTVLEDGSVVVPSVTMNPATFYLTFLRPDGSTSSQTMAALPPGFNFSSAYKAVPNSQGGFFVELNGPPALVVGVDGTCTVTGFAVLGDAWGDISVDGDDGTAIATSYVTYWNEPNYGGGAKRHLGMAEVLSASGNQAASASFYPPTGSCGYLYNGVVGTEGWYYNGDCDQPVISVTSVVAVSGGFIVSLSDGSVSGPGDGFGQIHMSHVEPRGTDTVVGSPVSGGLQEVSASATTLSTGFQASGSPQFDNAAFNPWQGIWVKGCTAALVTPYNHTAVVLVPRSQDLWRKFKQQDQPIFVNIDPKSKSYFATIGAASDLLLGLTCGGHLKSDINRGPDISEPPRSSLEYELVWYPPAVENQLIKTLLDLDSKYNDLLSYDCFPTASSTGYNSNSYVNGLLQAAGLEAHFPLFFGNTSFSINGYPGWTKPVPAENFK